jgi:hypothetical protein
MSVEDTNSVDVVSVDKQKGEVILTVSDHLDWSDIQTHESILQAKLNAYLRFVESGEILQSYPEAKDRRVVIAVVFKFPPGREAQEFLARVREVIKSAGMEFRHQLFAVSYDV